MLLDWILQFIGVVIVLVLAIMRAVNAWKDDCFKQARVSFIILMFGMGLSFMLLVVQGLSISHIFRRMLGKSRVTIANKEEDDVLVLPN